MCRRSRPLINNRYDPASNYRNAERRRGNARLLIANGLRALELQRSGTCVDRWRTCYLVDLVTPPRGTVCQPDLVPFA
jgi:hypothetical protein